MLPLMWLLSKQPIIHPCNLVRLLSSSLILSSSLHVCVLSGFSYVRLFATPWAIACQDPVSRILQVRILEWVVTPSLIFPTRDQTHLPFVSWAGKQIIYHWATADVLLFFRSQVFAECQHGPGTMLGGPWKGAVTKALDLTELIVVNTPHSHWCC